MALIDWSFMKLKELFRNFSYTIISNFISLAISTLAVLIVPKFIGIDQYGYWQLYIFYTTYVGALHFGWLDGIYLRYGGYRYDKLDKSSLYSQFIQFLLMQTIIAGIITFFGLFIGDRNQSYILFTTAIAMLFINLSQFFLYILQDTNRIREYAIITTIARVVYFIMVLMLLLFKVQNFKWFIISDLIGRFFALIYSIYCCRDIIFQKFSIFRWDFIETWKNLTIGIKLLVANFAGTLIIGIVRYGIQYFWSINIFGKLSLTLNISNLLMTFVNAIGLVLYPALRRMDKDKLRGFYLGIREVLNSILFLGLFLYYPISVILPIWLPKYEDSLSYMAILFPMCVYSGKFALLIVTFMKTFRFEKELLMVNITSVIFSFITTFFSAKIFHNLVVLVFSIVLILWFQSGLGEYILGRKLKLNTLGRIFPESVVIVVFMLSNWYLNFWIGLLSYLIIYISYLGYNAKNIRRGVLQLRKSL